nr:hypothetical protein [Oceanococcus sp. HetDA_MAG_MS8]
MNDSVWWMTAAAFVLGMVLPWWQMRRRIRRRFAQRLQEQLGQQESPSQPDSHVNNTPGDLQKPRKSAQS